MQTKIKDSRLFNRGFVTKVALLALLVFSLPGYANGYDHKGNHAKN